MSGGVRFDSQPHISIASWGNMRPTPQLCLRPACTWHICAAAASLAGRAVTLLNSSPGPCCAGALTYLHAHDVLHGDLTPSNVLLTSSTKDGRRWQAKVGRGGRRVEALSCRWPLRATRR